MVAFKVENFGGMNPMQDPKLLPPNFAARSENAWLYSGSLRGFRTPATVHTTAVGTTKVFRIPVAEASTEITSFGNSVWMEFTDIDTDVVRAPMINDQYRRIYWSSPSTGPMFNTFARIQAGLDPYKLGIPSPTTAPTIVADRTHTLSETFVHYNADQAVGKESSFTENEDGSSTIEIVLQNADGSADSHITVSTPNLTVVRSYLYTFISEFGEESAPSPAKLATGDTGSTWTLTLGVPTDTAQRATITKTRVYRTITSSAGVATFFFVADLPAGTTVFIDSYSDELVASQGQLEATSWSPPPSDLQGMVAMPNGMLCGWTKQDLWFCEPYRPHAWPVEYVVSVEHPIVGIGVFGTTALVCTTGFPFTATGVHPANVSLSKIMVHEPCVARGSIVSSFDGVFYASQNGLVMASPGMCANITIDLISKTDWQALDPTNIRAVRHGPAYLAYPTGNSANRNGFVISSQQQRALFNFMPVEQTFTNVQEDLWTGEVFLIGDRAVQHFDPPAAVMQPFKWRSKEFQLMVPKNMEGIRVWFRVTPGAPTLVDRNEAPTVLTEDMYGLVRVYADDNLVFTRELRKSGELFRLPSGFMCETWQIEIEARVQVSNFQIATAVKELAIV